MALARPVRACSSSSTAGGSRRPGPGNAVELADTPVFDDLWARYPHTQLTACGRAVGLPEGQMGNSEVGHLNLGAGAVIKQDLTRIDEAVADGALGDNAVLRRGAARPRARAPDRPRLRRRRALVARAPRRADRARRGDGVARRRRPRLHRRPRHVADRRRGASSQRGRRRGGTRRVGIGDRALLRDGPRPPRGAHAGGARPARATARPSTTPTTRRGRRCAPPTSAARPTSSSSRRLSARRRASGRSDCVIAFNFRPDRMRQLTEALGAAASRDTRR